MPPMLSFHFIINKLNPIIMAEYRPIVVEFYHYSDYSFAINELCRNSVSYFDTCNVTSTVYYIILPSWFTSSDLMAQCFFEKLQKKHIKYFVRNTHLSF